MPATSAESPADPVLQKAFAQAHAALGLDYQPNTHLLEEDGSPRYTNRLILESSPYLLQHAHNPVEWHPWGEEALAAARREDRPVLLSIGYATCHWCHVMEEESFDNEEVARALNANFIAIKIDREARPDLDHTYMLTTQLLTGQGGWPNTLLLLPDGRPFHAGTYYPKASFLQLLAAVTEIWNSPRRAELAEQAERIADTVTRITTQRAPPAPIDETVFGKAAAGLLHAHNRTDGGFGQTMQFPQETYLLFLLDRWRRTGDDGVLAAACKTLRAIAAGGIHDHAGGGFHRYTVDPNWRTPHFEKMLYNQALLSRAFLEAHAATGEPGFARAARRAFDYVIRDMTARDGAAAGAFYAAEDADSLTPSGRREEGYFYVWTPGTLRDVLGEKNGTLAVSMLGIDQPATVESGSVAHLDPKAATDFATLDPLLDQLRETREARPRPRRDDKVIGDWNGLMIRALAEGAIQLEAPHYAETACRAANAIRESLADGSGGLHRFHAHGRAEGAAQLSDYASLGLAFLALETATGDADWRQRAEEMAASIEKRFDDGAGRFRQAEANGPLGPVYDFDDGAVPSGESAALELLARLAMRSENPHHRARAEGLRDAVSGLTAAHPLQKTSGLIAASILQSGESEPARSVAYGHGRAMARFADGILHMQITLDPDWHVNSNQPLEEDLIATELAVIEGTPPTRITYPQPVERELGFSDRPLALFEGSFAIRAEWDGPVEAPLSVALTLQPCSDRICLPPETYTFRLR